MNPIQDSDDSFAKLAQLSSDTYAARMLITCELLSHKIEQTAQFVRQRHGIAITFSDNSDKALVTFFVGQVPFQN